jgi:pyruvate-formate lyase-activating enzyme
LVQIGFLKDLLVSLRVFHLPLYLETNGTMPSRLRRIIKDVDIVAMDIKQPSYPGIEVKWDETKECLKIASIKELIVKVVITQATGYRDIVKAGQLILEIAPEAPLILQPVTPRGGIYPPPPTQVRRFAKLCRDKGLRTYVIPQLHKLAGWR